MINSPTAVRLLAWLASVVHKVLDEQLGLLLVRLLDHHLLLIFLLLWFCCWPTHMFCLALYLPVFFGATMIVGISWERWMLCSSLPSNHS